MQRLIRKSLNSVAAAGLLSALLASGSAMAAGVTGVSVTPAKGLTATQYTVNIQGTGQCDVQIATGMVGADGWALTVTENLPKGSFPREWKFKSPIPFGNKVAPGNLPVGKYTVTARGLPANVCNLEQHFTTFEVVAPVNIAPLPTCPEGWTLANHNQAGAYTCKPKKPAAASCPPKHEWFDDGCSAGCRQVAY